MAITHPDLDAGDFPHVSKNRWRSLLEYFSLVRKYYYMTNGIAIA